MWYKKDAGYWHNPTWLAMPWASALVFDYLLADCKLFGSRDGRVSVTHWRPETILHVLRLPVPADDISEAMKALEDCGKVAVEGDEVSVSDWNVFQTDPTNADRQKKHRVTVKSKTDSNSVETESNSYVTPDNGAVTLRTVSNGEIERIERIEREREHAPARFEIEDPRGNENEWDWTALPAELLEQVSVLKGGKKDRYVAAVRLLWYWPDLGAQEAQELAVQTCGLYIDKGLEIREALATAAADRRRKDGLSGFGHFLSRWLGIELINQHKANRTAGGPGIVESPKKQAAWEIEATRMQKLWDEKHGKKPAVG
jgi:hypothetical protein